MNKFRLTLYKWEFGVLNTVKSTFESIETAIEHVAKMVDEEGEFVAKVLNMEGELVHWVDHKHPCSDDDTYA